MALNLILVQRPTQNISFSETQDVLNGYHETLLSWKHLE